MATVIETHNDNGVEWGVSFGDGCNPEPEDYVATLTREDAFKLKQIIDGMSA